MWAVGAHDGPGKRKVAGNQTQHGPGRKRALSILSLVTVWTPYWQVSDKRRLGIWWFHLHNTSLRARACFFSPVYVHTLHCKLQILSSFPLPPGSQHQTWTDQHEVDCEDEEDVSPHIGSPVDITLRNGDALGLCAATLFVSDGCAADGDGRAQRTSRHVASCMPLPKTNDAN
jgi:hypothetical protein